MPDGPGAGDRVLRSLGLARRAGRAAVGTRAVLEAASRGDLALLVVAGDAAGNALERLDAARRAAVVGELSWADKASLGDAVGRGPVAAVGVTDRGLAEKVLASAGTAGRGARRSAAEER